MKKISYAIAALLCGAALTTAYGVTAHEFVYTPDSAQRTNTNMPTLTANMESIRYSDLLYGFQLNISVNGANLNTTNVNTIKNATHLSSPNVVRPYRITNNTISYRISGEHDLRAINFVTLTLDQAVLSAPQSLSITLPVFHDITPPDQPHEDANTIAALNVDSVNATDFLNGSGKVFTVTLAQGAFLPGCSDAIAHSIMNTSNVQGIVRIWRKTANQVEFVVEGGHYQTNAGNWNFELGPDTNTLNQTLHISAPINH
ncbi:hypothetical protein [Photobacterium kishitanii]|uniref:hypothetical protein n=1 Tax=Photobacterium kishitanii TaxID=318456 RepID=UPI0007F8C98C|nr:hypothetical protein [Photobacterium kishitanii]OBU32922.1 hypothetical protein AYY23_16100 [Photobacterium kishitanii]PSU18319.1 hypothetical protein CTM84_17990 [Photobacterium kishitanii]PSU87442.1 hypothetical protein C0W42_16260 [Photobacterium kishitanii]PSU93516.1 hypothetical protein C0W35_11525 [Photobacterium kishitanii]PSV11944.1 hypothetical protein C0W59_18970 [Photobacterium kishitanii]